MQSMKKILWKFPSNESIKLHLFKPILSHQNCTWQLNIPWTIFCNGFGPRIESVKISSFKLFATQWIMVCVHWAFWNFNFPPWRDVKQFEVSIRTWFNFGDLIMGWSWFDLAAFWVPWWDQIKTGFNLKILFSDDCIHSLFADMVIPGNVAIEVDHDSGGLCRHLWFPSVHPWVMDHCKNSNWFSSSITCIITLLLMCVHNTAEHIKSPTCSLNWVLPALNQFATVFKLHLVFA